MTSSTESRGRVPDFFVVGHPKSGTTALYEMLRRHPQIYMPELKEPRFFAGDLRARFQPRASARGRPPVFPETFDEYLSLFDAALPGQRVGEASPSYLMSSIAAQEIARAQPAARIVAILREPASFLRSLQLELVQNHIESERDFRKAMAKEALGALGEGPNAAPAIRRYSDRVRYVEQLRRYHAAFPSEQVLVLIYDDFREDNEGTLRRVLRFLNVDDTVALETVRANPTVYVRSVRLDRVVRSLYAGRGPLARAVNRTIKALTPTGWRGERFQAIRRGLLYGTPRAPDEAFMRELRSRFKAEVLATSEYLGRDLVTLWGYDVID
jgi:Sulfotransferase family